jgi:isocitrate/isopropylmalate dehydrogenase
MQMTISSPEAVVVHRAALREKLEADARKRQGGMAFYIQEERATLPIEASNPLPDETVEKCLASDGVLLGAVGHPRFNDPRARVRPEQGLLGLRKAMGVFANLRSVKLYLRTRICRIHGFLSRFMFYVFFARITSSELALLHTPRVTSG